MTEPILLRTKLKTPEAVVAFDQMEQENSFRNAECLGALKTIVSLVNAHAIDPELKEPLEAWASINPPLQLNIRGVQIWPPVFP